MKRILIRIGVALVFLVLVLVIVSFWMGSNMILNPVWRGVSKNLAAGTPETEKYWGPGYGNLRTTHQYKFSEVKFHSVNGYDLSGWLVKSADNNFGAAKGAIMLVHGGGGDRREETRYIHFFLSQHLDVLTFDYGCMGEAPCPVPGMSYGDRESKDVLSAYLFLTNSYQKIYAMGTSVGAGSILIALPGMPKLSGVIAENPMASFQKLLTETPSSQSMPKWLLNTMIGFVKLRGRFDGLANAENSLRVVKTTPILFIHSQKDNVIPVRQTQQLAALYNGPKSTWYPNYGNHAFIWDIDHAAYEKRIVTFIESTN